MVILTTFRLIWLNLFATPQHPHAIHGVLDLRGYPSIHEHTIKLNGEWEFYPQIFLMETDQTFDQLIKERKFIQVPSNWADSNNAYDFGSYRLKILIDTPQDNRFGIRIKNIKSASEIYINGELINASGQPAHQKENYVPKNTPYTTYFSLDNTEEIEIVIQAANFDHPLEGGIISPIQFGLSQPFYKESQLALNMLIISCIVYLFHAIYSVVLYFIGGKDFRFIYFALMTICIIIATLNGERLLYEWFPISFHWHVKINSFTMIAGAFFLFQCIKHLLSNRLQKIFTKPYLFICIVLGMAIIFLPATYHYLFKYIYILFMLIPCFLLIYVTYRATSRINYENIFILLTAIAAVTSLIWFIIIYTKQIDTLPYPIDLMIALICFSAYWFKQYFKNYTEVQKLAYELQLADQQKNQFLANTSHELRNPIHGIVNITGSLLQQYDHSLEEKVKQDLQLLVTIGRRMSLMLNDLIDITRLQEGRIILQKKRLHIQSVASGVFDMLRFMTEKKELQVYIDIPDDFPEIWADENRLVQILYNLLHNAVKFTNHGTITLRAELKDKMAAIHIIDTGIGIDQKTQERIFEPYVQGNPHITGNEGGLGLGLNISQQLVLMHGGELSVHSQPGHGSTFTFTLPLAKRREDDIESTKSQPDIMSFREAYEEQATEQDVPKTYVNITQLETTFPSFRPTILAVDDEPVNLFILSSILPPDEYDLTTVTSGREALELLHTKEWDLLIVDVMMPHISGYDLTRMVREQYTSTELPILLLTARSQPTDTVAGFLAGANDYVTKPIESLELRVRINKLTQAKQLFNERLRMEVALLQAQIQPHFLFNTLNSISSLSEIDTNKMTRLLTEFGNYLRRSFDPRNTQNLIPIEHELDLLQSYLYIEKERFGDRLNIIWEVDDSIDAQIPPLTIQPLVENAIVHGVLKRIQGGTVRIHIKENNDGILCLIEDDGVGMSKEKLTKIFSKKSYEERGIGIYNTHIRLKKSYGHGLYINSQENIGTTISFQIPKR